MLIGQLSHYHKDAEAHSNLASMLNELGRLDEAEASFKQAIALKPDIAEVWSNLGINLQRQGKLEEAETSYNRSIALKPSNAEAHNNLAITLQEQGRLDEAQVSFTRAIILEPDHANALYNRSKLLFDKAEHRAALIDADASSLKQAKALSLTLLYALGRVNEIYKRLELLSKSDAEDRRLAGFAAFISEVEGKPTAFDFCPKPIDLIHNANLSSHVVDSAAYAESIIEELENIQKIWEPYGNSTVNGFQSLKGTNLFKNLSGKIAQLKSVILTEVETYYSKFKNEKCRFIQKFPATRDIFGWTVILKQQGYQNAHIHPGGWLSGVVYLKTVPSLEKNEGAIQFSLNRKDYHDARARNLMFRPTVGDIVLFPSSLHHKTIPFTTDMDRIIVSFDLIPEASRREFSRTNLNTKTY